MHDRLAVRFVAALQSGGHPPSDGGESGTSATSVVPGPTAPRTASPGTDRPPPARARCSTARCILGAIVAWGMLGAACDRDASAPPESTPRPTETTDPSAGAATDPGLPTQAARTPSPKPESTPCSADLDAIASTLESADVPTLREGPCELTIVPGFGAGVPALAALAGTLEHDQGAVTAFDAVWLEREGDRTHYDMSTNRLLVSTEAVRNPDTLGEAMLDARARARVGGALRTGVPALWYGVVIEGERARDLSDVAVAIDRVDRGLAAIDDAGDDAAQRAALRARLAARATALAVLSAALSEAIAPCAASFSAAEILEAETRAGVLTARVTTPEVTCVIELPGVEESAATGALHLRLEAMRTRLRALNERARKVASGELGVDWRTGLVGTR